MSKLQFANSEKIVSSILSLGGGTVLARLVAFFGTTYTARVLGPEGFGIIGFGLALSGYLSLAVTAGINVIGIREVARYPNRAVDLASSVIAVRLILASITFALMGVLAWYLPKPAIVKLVVFLTGLSFFSFALDTTWVHKGLEQNRRVGFAILLTEIIYVALLFLLVRRPSDVIFVPLALFGGQIAAACFLGKSLFHQSKIKVRLHQGWRFFGLCKFLVVTKLLRTLIFSFDIVLLGFIATEHEVGLYVAAYRICYFLLAFSGIISFSYLPSFTRAVSESLNDVTDLASRSVEMSCFIALPFVFGGAIAALPLMVAIYGDNYSEAALGFQILLISVGCLFIRETFGNILHVYDLLKQETQIMAVACGLNIGLDFLLIPDYGLVGAAIATALADGVALIVVFWIVYKLGIRLDLKPFLKILLSTGLMGAILVLLSSALPVYYLIAVGIVTYLGWIVLFRAVPRDILHYLNAAHAI